MSSTGHALLSQTDDDKSASRPLSLLTGQWIHLGFSALTVPLVVHFVPADCHKHSLGLPLCAWFYIALAVPVLHCIFVWLCWRLELTKQTLTRVWGGGDTDRAFEVYFRLFFFLFGSRFLSLLLLAIADHDSEQFLERFWVRAVIAVPIALVGGYTMYCVKTYWGPTTKDSFARASGKDHFFPADFRDLPMVTEGIFKYTSNGMYVFALQNLWLFGVIGASRLALAAAAFNVVHIWFHYWGTERPDMQYIYGRGNDRGKAKE